MQQRSYKPPQRIGYSGACAQLVILTYFIVFGVVISLIMPPFEAPDEPFHLDYINFIAERFRLPNQLIPDQAVLGEGNQHPLYYLICGAIIRVIDRNNRVDYALTPNPSHPFFGGDPENRVARFLHPKSDFASAEDRMEFYCLRWISLLFGAGTIIVLIKLGNLVFENSKWALAPAALAASLPQFAYMSVVINNDALANLTAALVFYFALRVLKKPEEVYNYIFLGIFTGLSWSAKKTTLFLLPALVLLLVLMLSGRKTTLSKALGRSLVVVAGAGLTSGWVFARNWVLYGDPLGSSLEALQFAKPALTKSMGELRFWIPMLPRLAASFIANFGWMNARPPLGSFVVHLLIFSAAGAGLIKLLLKNRRLRRVAVYASLTALFCFGGIIYFNLTYTQHQGRWLFPALAPIMLSAGMGIREIYGGLDKIRLKRLAVWAVLIGLFGFDIFNVYWMVQFYHIQS